MSEHNNETLKSPLLFVNFTFHQSSRPESQNKYGIWEVNGTIGNAPEMLLGKCGGAITERSLSFDIAEGVGISVVRETYDDEIYTSYSPQTDIHLYFVSTFALIRHAIYLAGDSRIGVLGKTTIKQQ